MSEHTPKASGAEQVGRAFTVEMIEHEAKEWLSTGLIDDSDKRAVTSFVKWLSALVPIAEKGEDWLPISTAPKSGDEFIFLYCPEDDSRWLAKWQGGRWYGVDDLGLTREGHSAGDPDVVTGWAVTHWRPLPAPPLSHQSKEG